MRLGALFFLVSAYSAIMAGPLTTVPATAPLYSTSYIPYDEREVLLQQRLTELNEALTKDLLDIENIFGRRISDYQKFARIDFFWIWMGATALLTIGGGHFAGYLNETYQMSPDSTFWIPMVGFLGPILTILLSDLAKRRWEPQANLVVKKFNASAYEIMKVGTEIPISYRHNLLVIENQFDGLRGELDRTHEEAQKKLLNNRAWVRGSRLHLQSLLLKIFYQASSIYLAERELQARSLLRGVEFKSSMNPTCGMMLKFLLAGETPWIK